MASVRSQICRMNGIVGTHGARLIRFAAAVAIQGDI